MKRLRLNIVFIIHECIVKPVIDNTSYKLLVLKENRLRHLAEGSSKRKLVSLIALLVS